jgi:hypothetical protein
MKWKHIHSSVLIMEKVSFWHGFFNSDFWAKGWSVSLYMGYSRKVESKSFLMVVVSDRTSHFIAKNFNLIMGFFRRKITVIGQPWVNSTKNLGIIGPSEVYRMVHLNFGLKIFIDVFLEKNCFQGVSTWSNFSGCGAGISKNSNTSDLFYSWMDLSIAIIKLGSNFLTFPTIVRFL